VPARHSLLSGYCGYDAQAVDSVEQQPLTHTCHPASNFAVMHNNALAQHVVRCDLLILLRLRDGRLS
jgi:hypothetical protein